MLISRRLMWFGVFCAIFPIFFFVRPSFVPPSLLVAGDGWDCFSLSLFYRLFNEEEKPLMLFNMLVAIVFIKIRKLCREISYHEYRSPSQNVKQTLKAPNLEHQTSLANDVTTTAQIFSCKLVWNGSHLDDSIFFSSLLVFLFRPANRFLRGENVIRYHFYHFCSLW